MARRWSAARGRATIRSPSKAQREHKDREAERESERERERVRVRARKQTTCDVRRHSGVPLRKAGKVAIAARRFAKPRKLAGIRCCAMAGLHMKPPPPGGRTPFAKTSRRCYRSAPAHGQRRCPAPSAPKSPATPRCHRSAPANCQRRCPRAAGPAKGPSPVPPGLIS